MSSSTIILDPSCMFWSNPGSFLFNDDHLLPFLIFCFYFLTDNLWIWWVFPGPGMERDYLQPGYMAAEGNSAQLNPEPKLNIKNKFQSLDSVSGKYIVPFPRCDVLHRNLCTGQRGWFEIKSRPRACRSMHSWVADSSTVFPLNILIRMNLLRKKKRWQSVWQNRNRYFKIKSLTFYFDLILWFVTAEWSRRVWIIISHYSFHVSVSELVVLKL